MRSMELVSGRGGGCSGCKSERLAFRVRGLGQLLRSRKPSVWTTTWTIISLNPINPANPLNPVIFVNPIQDLKPCRSYNRYTAYKRYEAHSRILAHKP